ncbi:phosphonate metabolism transcriptional regulator PhnF [Polaromonas sp.]|jgi:GntR family phosphonate transport system transcriptional regulator|uniref:phosphonate metabolism transcriptional regulator PhnF n=1 Tax=Polaromonas sp. TaxID=1869339 RepID=UPI001D4E63F1|nr:phosphonate metabolism transcriptional regulator PhnF [Polaromonas sp.]MBT9474920.1 phosphonate metabolism transcriptional regulator PhnF [Polaromonas sp.]
MTSLTSSAHPLERAPRESFWTRIASDIAESISRGTYPPGERLPSEHALAELFGVNRHTIRKSLASLSSQGLVRVAQGSGTYVEEFAVDLMLAKRTRHHQSLSQAGLRGGLQVLTTRTQRAAVAQASALKVALRSKLLCLQVLGEAQGQPLHVSERYFPLPRFAGLDAIVGETGSITAAFATLGVADYTRQESRITAQMPDATIAAHLRQPVSRPILQVKSVNVDTAGLPIEFATTWFAGDRVKLTVTHDD